MNKCFYKFSDKKFKDSNCDLLISGFKDNDELKYLLNVFDLNLGKYEFLEEFCVFLERFFFSIFFLFKRLIKIFM